MSKKFPECPLYNHNNCRDLHIEQICAIVRNDKVCLKKAKKTQKQSANIASQRIREESHAY